MSASLHRFTTWLCLAAALLMGAAPRQGLVLCLEPGGKALVELATAENRCGGCPDLEALDEGASAGAASLASHPEDCRCVDVPLMDRRDASTVQGKLLALGFADVAIAEAHPARLIRAPRLEAVSRVIARPCGPLESMRGVVLLV